MDIPGSIIVVAVPSKRSSEYQVPVNLTIYTHVFPRPARPEKEIRGEIRAILKQIVGSNAYMPTLSDPCIFDILAYTEGNTEVPVEEWRDGHLIEAGKTQTVKLKSFDASLHRIDAMVAYRYEG